MSDVDLSRYVAIVWKWLWLIIIVTSIAAAVSYRVSQTMPPVYLTSVTLMLGESAANPNVTPDDVAISQRLANTYAQLVQREPVLSSTIKAISLPTDWRTLRGHILVSHTDGSQLFEIRVTDGDPRRAKLIADELARQLILQSPTAQNVAQMETRRQFVQQQLDELQANIKQADGELANQRTLLSQETSARGVFDRQDEIKALELKLNDWRSTYASLLSTNLQKPPNTLTVIETADVPTDPISPNVRANVLIAAALGLMLAVAVVFVVETVDDTLDSVERVSRVLALPSIGVLGKLSRGTGSSKRVLAANEPRSPVAEAFRVLRTNILFASLDDNPVAILVTSPGPREGKSFTAANLAVSFAQMGRRVILVDADLRHPMLHAYFGVSNELGLTSVFLGDARPADARLAALNFSPPHPSQVEVARLKRRLVDALLLPTKVPGVSLLPSGPIPINPTELLGSPTMEQILKILEGMADVVIVDGPPVLATADATVLASQGLSVALVVESGATRSGAARMTYDALLRARARVLGVILNKASKSSLLHPYQVKDDGGVRNARLPSAASLSDSIKTVFSRSRKQESHPTSQIVATTDATDPGEDQVFAKE